MPDLIDVSSPDKPGWWLHRLIGRLAAEQARYQLLDDYYTGEIIVPLTASKATRDAYRRLMSMARTNYAELVVEAVRERMSPLGFRTGAAADRSGDAEAWRIWQANSLDADAALVFRSKLSMSKAYMIVGGVDPDTNAPTITPEDPREVITEQHPVKRRQSIAALKVFRDDFYGSDRAFLYMPGRVYRYARPSTCGAISVDLSGWEEDSYDDLPVDVVPVVEFANRRSMHGGPKGEFETHLGMLDRINYGVLNRLEIATMQAFRQRGIKGVPSTDGQGDYINYDDVFAADPGAMWLLPATAEVWESGQVDLGPVLNAGRHDVQDLAAVTRTPLFYLTPDATNGSAEGASLAREGLVFKTYDRLGETGEELEQVMALAFLIAGDEVRARRTDMQVIWAPPERFSLAERYDAAAKAQAAGVPWRNVMEDVLQFDPQTTDRMEEERNKDAALAHEVLTEPVTTGAERAAVIAAPV